MKTGFEFIQRIQEDAEFRQKVNACPNGLARLAFCSVKVMISPRLPKF